MTLEALSTQQISFDPFLPVMVIVAFVALATLAAFAAQRQRAWVRALAIVLIGLCALQPVMLEKIVKPVPDVVALVVDRSASQTLHHRAAQTQKATAALEQKLATLPGFTVRTLDITGQSQTDMFTALEDTLADVPTAQRAGVIVMSDGQIHDAPQTGTDSYGPFHVLLSGERSDFDRRLELRAAPAFGITGKTITVKLRLYEDGVAHTTGTLPLTVDDGTGAPYPIRVTTGQDISVTMPVTQTGENAFVFSVPVQDDEVSATNNTLPLIVKGVRDRLNVLLVSGEPHAGGRIWRDMLRGDPAVDLVHFTILRNSFSLDTAGRDELSLIPFPFEELFEEKLKDFDLIIFDRYRKNDIMPMLYFANIAQYVRGGGALLEVSGPSFSGPESIAHAPLSEILPAQPTGQMLRAPYKPQLTEQGTRHPVTAPFSGAQNNWGPWLFVNAVEKVQGRVLLRTNTTGAPLLILNTVDQGRVAQITSDQVWLWARGYQGGGPAADLFRRVAHWLMKEPALEETTFEVTSTPSSITITQRTQDGPVKPLTLTRPDGTSTPITFEAGATTQTIPALAPGLYRVSDDTKTKSVLMGYSDAPELQQVMATEKLLAPMVKASRGSVQRLYDGVPDLRSVAAGRMVYGGAGWVGLRHSGTQDVQEIRQTPLLPPWGWFAVLVGTLALMWVYESGRLRR